MTRAEITELTLIPLVAAGYANFTSPQTACTPVGSILISCALLLLVQSLVRDLYLLVRMRRTPQATTRTSARCLCLESAVGLSGVVAGALLLGAAVPYGFVMDGWAWGAVSFATLLLGYRIKDYVFEWNPWRIRRDKDHHQIIFAWK